MIVSAPIVPNVITIFDCKHNIIVDIKNGNIAIVILNDLLFMILQTERTLKL